MDANGRADRSHTSFATRLNNLFATVTDESTGQRREYTTPYVAKAISEDPSHGTTLSRVYLNGLRNGTNTNPTVAVVRALAKFFDDHRYPDTSPITAACLLSDESPDDRVLLAKLSDSQVRRIAVRACNMDVHLRERVLRMFDVLERPDSGRSKDNPS